MSFKRIHKILVCKDCQAQFWGIHTRKYCDNCRESRQKQSNRYRSNIRPFSSLDQCQICGQEYIVTGGMQRYCSICRDAVIRKKALERYHQNKDTTNVLRNEKRKQQRKLKNKRKK